MRGYQEQNREGDLGRSPGIGWTGRSKVNNIQHVGPGRYIWYQSRGRLILKCRDCKRSHIGSERPEPWPYKWCWLLTCCTRFGAMRGYQEQNERGTWVESLELGGLGGPKRTIYNMLGQTVTGSTLIPMSVMSYQLYLNKNTLFCSLWYYSSMTSSNLP